MPAPEPWQALKLQLKGIHAMHEVCEVCGRAIDRDCYVDTSAPVSAAWLGVCECPNRKWRWRSASGEAPWELIGRGVDKFAHSGDEAR